MHYDPIKDALGAFFSSHPALQRLFYLLLHLVFLRSWYVRRALRDIAARWPSDRRIDVLDAGTGFGQYAYYIARRNPNARVLAVDIKPDYLENARRFVDRTSCRDRIIFERQDLTDPDIERRFDVIVSVDVMEHIEDDRAVFRHFERLLKDGGHVIINTPSDRGGSDVEAEGEEGFIDEHVRPGYNMDELCRKLEEAGLEPVEARYTYGTYGSQAWRLLIKHPMRLLSRTKLAFAILPIYYLVALPVGTVLNWMDVRTDNASGTGLIVVAGK
ncbi:MAG: class I SAM-dependent methyltransferase [Rhodothermales bacterium]